MSPSLVAVIIFAVLVIVVLVKTAVIVPQKKRVHH